MPCINLLQVLEICAAHLSKSLGGTMHVTAHTHTLAHMILKKYMPLRMWWIRKVPFSREHLDTFCKINTEATEIRTVGFISWLKRAEKFPNFRGIVFPFSLPRYQMQRSFMSFSYSIWSNWSNKTRSQQHQPWNCYSTYHGLRSIG